ncbi:MAG TPA: gluconeogenesis factor YvcK family protein [Ktedonobacterales bacterium]|nr:gluconeogenesis factor YvcK family protein [Ktedonobacterales bacterium]
MGDDQDVKLDPTTLARLKGKRVVTIGGGTGPFAVLSSLKQYPCAITAIVTMSDSGGSSRRLMDEFGQLPFGDLRQALVALSRRENLWRDVFTFRFEPGHGHNGNGHSDLTGHPTSFMSLNDDPGNSHARLVAREAGVTGHSLGNLIISALEEMFGGDLLTAITKAQELLDTAGTVLPVTLAHSTLCAELEGDETICGETDIDTRGEKNFGTLPPIKGIFLENPAPACDEALRAIRRADLIVLGPGDLYTSILPNLLVDGMTEAIAASHAEKIYVCNLMTKHGETDGYRASEFVLQVQRYLEGPVDRVILHDGIFPEDVVRAYAAQAQYPVEADVERVQQLVPQVIVESVLAVHRSNYVRHDPARLLHAIFSAPIQTTAQPEGRR